MERVISTNDRIKRAEEIYQRRRESQRYVGNQTRVNVGDTSKSYGLFKKMSIQIIVCLIVYIAFLAIKNNEYIFSDVFLKQTKEILAYDIDIKGTYENIRKWFNGIQESKKEGQDEPTDNIENETTDNLEKKEEAIDEPASDENLETTIDSNALTPNSGEETLSANEEASSINEPQTDAEIIKNNYSIIKPLIRNNYIKIWDKKSYNSNCSKISYRD